MVMRAFHRNTSGFTIVELLVVIVVIGILATITIVTYNGVIAKAARANDIEMLRSYMTGLQILAANNDLPLVNACMGPPSTYPNDSQTNCLEGGQYATKAASAALNAKLNAVGVKDQVFKQSVAVTPQFLYNYAGSGYSAVGYNMPADTTCGFGNILSRKDSNGDADATTAWGTWGAPITFVNKQADKAVFCLVVVPL